MTLKSLPARRSSPVAITCPPCSAIPGAPPLVPSIVTRLVICGSALARLIVPKVLNVIVSAPPFALALVMACRSEPAPESFRLVTV